jgi:head-tail adaptor
MSIESFFTTGITYKVPTETRDAAGGVIETLGSAVSLLGRIRPMTGSEVLASDKLNIISTHILYCLPESGLTVKCRVYYGSDTYLVKFIKNPMTYDKYWMVNLELIK